MERLTGRDEGNAYFTECFEEPCLGMGCINENCEFLQLVCERLAAYEDIGPTPEQLLEIDKMYAEKCREVAELKKQLGASKTGDLISRQALKIKFAEVVQYPSFLYDGIVNVIDRQPTVYDAEKVMEQLDDYLFEKYCIEGDGKIYEILKGGGVDES